MYPDDGTQDRGGKLQVLKKAFVGSILTALLGGVMVMPASATPLSVRTGTGLTAHVATSPATRDESSLLAGEPSAAFGPAYPGHVDKFYYTHDAAGGGSAIRFVHSDAGCAWAMCTIQEDASRSRYIVFMFVPYLWACNLLTLTNFRGLWDTHDHVNNGVVEFLDASSHVIGTYGGGRRDSVNWSPIYYVWFCPAS
jgi:hypothetical protein